jgi:hypothetical protein
MSDRLYDSYIAVLELNINLREEILRLQAALEEKQALYEVVSNAGQVYLTNMELLEKKVFQLTNENITLKERIKELEE